MTVYLENQRKGKVRECDDRAEAEDAKSDLIGLGVNPEDLTITTDDPRDEATDGGETDTVDVDVVDHTEDTQEPEPDTDALAELGEELGTDPLEILPSHMIDRIQGKPAVNKRGYAMIAERYNIAVSAEILQYPWENDDNRAVCRAVARTDDGREYSGIGTASAADGDMEDQILELAETRSLKRAISWASGVGIVGYQELKQELEE
jgi:hypothetical protein